MSRLPDKYRAPIVLCYLEGLTHDEAAARLSWPVGTVRSRLARARDTLRHRLTRRGVTSPAALGPLSGWLAGEPLAPSASVAVIPSELVASITKAVSQLSASRTAASVIGSAPLHCFIAQGVLKTMMLKKLIVAICAILPLGTIVFGGGLFLVRKSRAQDHKPPAAESIKKSDADAQKGVPQASRGRPISSGVAQGRARTVRVAACLLRGGPDHDRPVRRCQ